MDQLFHRSYWCLWMKHFTVHYVIIYPLQRSHLVRILGALNTSRDGYSTILESVLGTLQRGGWQCPLCALGIHQATELCLGKRARAQEQEQGEGLKNAGKPMMSLHPFPPRALYEQN